MLGGRGPTRMELGCRERAALAVDSTVPSAAVTDGTACMPPGVNAAAGWAGDLGVPAAAAGGSAAAGSGGLKKTGKGDPPIGDPFTSTLS